MVLHFTRPREVAAHTICAANGSQVCGSHNVAISWDCSIPDENNDNLDDSLEGEEVGGVGDLNLFIVH